MKQGPGVGSPKINRKRVPVQSLLAAGILALAILAHALLPRYEMSEAGRLDRWTGEVCQLVLAEPKPENPFMELGKGDPWQRPGSVLLACTR